MTGHLTGLALNAVAALATALLLLMLGVTVFNAMTARRMHAPGTVADRGQNRNAGRISILIPARNEADRIGETLAAVLRMMSADEVLVLDDRSSDATAATVTDIASRDPRVRLLHGTDTPVGWTGKNWACEQLAAHASGDVLIFCDADVRPIADAAAATAAALGDADVITALPRQHYASAMQAAVIPLLLHLPLLGLLPLRLVRAHPAPALRYGNGQWLAFRRDAYVRIGGHAAVAGELVEDMALAALAKRARARLLPLLATDHLTVAMYPSMPALRAGFTANLYPLLGGRAATCAGALAAFVLIAVAPLLLPLAGVWLPLLLLATIRIIHVLVTRDSPVGLLLHPFGALHALAIAGASCRAHRAGRVTWRGRPIAATALR